MQVLWPWTITYPLKREALSLIRYSISSRTKLIWGLDCTFHLLISVIIFESVVHEFPLIWFLFLFFFFLISQLYSFITVYSIQTDWESILRTSFWDRANSNHLGTSLPTNADQQQIERATNTAAKGKHFQLIFSSYMLLGKKKKKKGNTFNNLL